MDKSNEIKKIADTVIGTQTKVEATLEPNEYYLYSEAWRITTSELDELRKQMQITEIVIDGFSLMLVVKYK